MHSTAWRLPTLVGRHEVLARVLAQFREGRGVVLAGAAGVGKTSLAGVAARALAEGDQGRSTVWLRATEAARAIPFGALGPLLPPDLSTVHPALVPVLVAERLRDRAGRPGEPAPVLVVDDAQLLDDSSATTVLALVAGGTPLLATLRTQTTCSDAVTALWKDGLVEWVDVPPLDRSSTRAMLAAGLGSEVSEVAAASSELLWSRTQGNALYLSELLRFGTETGRFVREDGVWWWRGGAVVPPRLGNLLRRRFDDLSAAALDALDLLAFGAPLPYRTLAALVDDAAILELDAAGVAASDERDGAVVLRFAHPLLHGVAERRLTAARRAVLADRLRTAPVEHVDVVRRAAWEEAGTPPPNVEVLLAAADALMLSDPRGSARLAERAVGEERSVRVLVALSAAYAEAGEPAAARSRLDELRQVASARPMTDREWLSSGFEDLSLALWSERSPAAASEALRRLRDRPRCGSDDELDSVEGLIMLFSGRTADALVRADAVLARDPVPNVAVRALMTRLGALTLSERSADVLVTADRLLTRLSTTQVSATRYGLAHVLVALAQLLHSQSVRLPVLAGASGRWPIPPRDTTGSEPATWPLLAGVRHLRVGDLPAATCALRESLAQQTMGEGLFRSEAAAYLVVALAESGRTADAERVLADCPPDAVALFPGLRGWAEAAVRGASRPSVAAGQLAVEAAREAAAAGAAPVGLAYLSDAGRYGAPGLAADALPEFAECASPVALARAAAIRARVSGRPAALVEAAEASLAAELLLHARELATLAHGRADGPGAGEVRRRASRVVRKVADRLGDTAHPPSRGHRIPGLTERETETARLAATGRSDKEIADTLVVSVRTVESHLASAYRKLGIESRRMLSEVLTGGDTGS